MSTRSFTDMLMREVVSYHLLLVSLYEKKDQLLYIEAPALRKRYMDVIGDREQGVLEEELELQLLHRKQELIRIAINRREPINLAAIDVQLEEERQKLISSVEEEDQTLNELPALSEEDLQTLQKLYREITTAFHPAMNTDITDLQKELYEKAASAYQMQDLASLQLIHNVLFESPLEQSELAEVPVKEKSAAEIAQELSTDYALSKKIFPLFAPSQEQLELQSRLDRFEETREALESELLTIRSGFPFSAEETMNDPIKIREYLSDLEMRKRVCAEETESVLKEIDQLLEEHPHA